MVIVNGLNCVNYILVIDENGNFVDGFDGIDFVFMVVGVGFNGFLGYLDEFIGIYECDFYVVYGDIFGDIIDVLFV